MKMSVEQPSDCAKTKNYFIWEESFE